MNLSASQRWLHLVADIFQGKLVKPRGKLTKEILAYQSVVDMSRPIVTVPERKLGYKFMAAEAAWIISGDDLVETISPFSRDISNFSDDGVRFFGAYGPKIRDQLGYVMNALIKDADTRQAVINIWRENPPQTKDYPCTLNMQWLIRDGRLDCVVNMRSSDVWLGWPYDVFNFSMISTYLILHLRGIYFDLTLGNLYLTAGSQHLYETNWVAAEEALNRHDWVVTAPINPYDATPGDFLNSLWGMAYGDGALKGFYK